MTQSFPAILISFTFPPPHVIEIKFPVPSAEQRRSISNQCERTEINAFIYHFILDATVRYVYYIQSMRISYNNFFTVDLI